MSVTGKGMSPASFVRIKAPSAVPVPALRSRRRHGHSSSCRRAHSQDSSSSVSCHRHGTLHSLCGGVRGDGASGYRQSFLRGRRLRKFEINVSSDVITGDGSVEEEDESEKKRQEVRRIVMPSALVLLSSNLCRISMPVALVPLAATYGWNGATVGLIGSSFLWGYMATQLLGGALADAVGGKRALFVGMLLWFGATGALALATSVPVAAIVPTLCALRAVVGAGQGAMMSSMQQVVATHIPQKRRATALGAIYGGFHMGNIVGLVLCPLLIAMRSVEASFLAVALVGLPVIAFWQSNVPPKAKGEGASSTTAASSPSSTLSFVSLMRDCGMAPWAIVIATFVNHFAYFLFLNWMPAYFVSEYGVSLRASAKLSVAPWICCAIVSSASGVIADRVARMPGMTLTRVRKLFQCTSFVGTALSLVALSAANQPTAAMICFIACFGFISVGQAGFVANTGDIAPPRLVGRLFGLANTFGSLGGILSTSAAGILSEMSGFGFAWVFRSTAAVLLTGAMLYARFASAEPAVGGKKN